ncbi:hypothetical protein HMPREF3212_02560 [Citrobacter freundii]|nr:hypothetical protein AB07_2318 [Citrobacter freundii]KWZ90059.1 hypothetical protein HMPREF3212_02560 [Citrobacter freundii]
MLIFYYKCQWVVFLLLFAIFKTVTNFRLKYQKVEMASFAK